MMKQGAFDMITVSLEQVPSYLQEGEYFKSLHGGEDGVILVPDNVMKFDTTIADVEDLRHLLQSLQFWIACNQERIAQIVTYILSVGLNDEILGLLADFKVPFPFLYVLRLILQSTARGWGSDGCFSLAQHIRVNHSCSADFLVHLSGHASVLQIIASELDQTEKDAKINDFLNEYNLRSVGKEGALKLLMVLGDDDFGEDILFAEAAGSGHLLCLQYLLQRECSVNPATASNRAAHGGHLHILEYLRSVELLSNCPLYAAEAGHLHCIKYLLSIGQSCDTRISQCAALNGHLNVLTFLHENGCDWDGGTCYGAAEGGHLACLEYAHTNGCPWDENTCFKAASGGHLECLRYAHTNGCPWDDETVFHAMDNGQPCLVYAIENGCPYLETSAIDAFEWKVDDALFYILEHCTNLDNGIYLLAARKGRLDVLQACVNANIPVHKMTATAAAKEGHQVCVDFAVAHGCLVIDQA